MAQTRCPRCGKPAVLVDSARVSSVNVPGVEGERDVVERRIICPAPGGCGGRVLVVYRLDVYVGEDGKKSVPH